MKVKIDSINGTMTLQGVTPATIAVVMNAVQVAAQEYRQSRDRHLSTGATFFAQEAQRAAMTCAEIGRALDLADWS